jgi:protein arginine kinase activator
MAKLCESCREHDGVIRIAQSSGANTKELWLCERCSRRFGFERKPKSLYSAVADLASGLIDRSAAHRDAHGTARCPRCSTTFAAIRRTGKVGCSECYVTFGERIGRVVLGLAGRADHTGKYPERFSRYKRAFMDRERMRRSLDESLEREDYERAAKIRDSLRALERDTESDDAFLS